MPSFPDNVVHMTAWLGLTPVQVKDLRDAWPHILTPLSRLLENRGEHRPNDILAALHEHRMQLWLGHDGSFVVTQVGEFPTCRLLIVLYAGGDLETIKAHMEDLEVWARDRGCDRIRIHGRPGWARVFDMSQIGVTLERML